CPRRVGPQPRGRRIGRPPVLGTVARNKSTRSVKAMLAARRIHDNSMFRKKFLSLGSDVRSALSRERAALVRQACTLLLLRSSIRAPAPAPQLPSERQTDYPGKVPYAMF